MLLVDANLSTTSINISLCDITEFLIIEEKSNKRGDLHNMTAVIHDISLCKLATGLFAIITLFFFL